MVHEAQEPCARAYSKGRSPVVRQSLSYPVLRKNPVALFIEIDVFDLSIVTNLKFLFLYLEAKYICWF